MEESSQNANNSSILAFISVYGFLPYPTYFNIVHKLHKKARSAH